MNEETSFQAEVWATLSQINVNDHTNKKGNLTYLSWAWAWGTLMDKYPESKYTFDTPIMLDNGTVEVWVTLYIKQAKQTISRQMWLPVMDYKNAAIPSPSTRDISDTRMRCLVKAMAMFGLGHYLYAGEDLPKEADKIDPMVTKQAALDAALVKHGDAVLEIKEALAEGAYQAAYEVRAEIDDGDWVDLWVAPSKFENAPFTTEERKQLKSDEWASARTQFFEEKGE